MVVLKYKKQPGSQYLVLWAGRIIGRVRRGDDGQSWEGLRNCAERWSVGHSTRRDAGESVRLAYVAAPQEASNQ